MKTIGLTQGKIAIVDDDSFGLVSKHRWHAAKRSNTFYAGSRIGGKYILMHNLILGERGVDHIDGNGLNNLRINIRKCDQSQNGMNKSKKQGIYSSDYKGVYFYKPLSKWRAQIKLNGKMRCIGYFRNEIDAARAYNDAAKNTFGDFAKLNNVAIARKV